MDESLNEMLERVAIHDLLPRYNRGIDRADLAILNSVWAAEAWVDYGPGRVDAREWSATTVAGLRSNFLRTQHMLGQTVIDFTADGAWAETYCRAYHELDGPEGREEIVVGGRYLDDLVKENGAWKIAFRRYVMDWNTNGPSTSRSEGGIYDWLTRRSARAPDDASYTGL